MRQPAPKHSRPRPPAHRDTGARPEPGDFLPALGLDRLPELLPVSRVAEALHVSRQTVHRLLATGEICGLRVGPGGVRVFRDSLKDYLRRQLL